MTRRERLEAVINGEISEELIADCKRELEKLNEQSIKAKERVTPQKEENQRIGEEIIRVLSEGELQIEELKERLNVEVTRQRLSAICTNLIREGRIRSKDVKVKNKGKRKAYYI